DLNQAAVAALIPVVAAPRFVCHILDREFFLVWKRHVLERALAASLDGALKDRIELLAWDDERSPERFVPFNERAVPRESLVKAVEDLLKMRVGIGWRNSVI